MINNNHDPFSCTFQPIAEVGICGAHIKKFHLQFSTPITAPQLFNHNSLSLYISSENTDFKWEKLAIAYCEKKNASQYTMFIEQENLHTRLLKLDQLKFSQIACKIRFKAEFNTAIYNINHQCLAQTLFLSIKCPESEQFTTHKFENLSYSLYCSNDQSQISPLIIFLHGAGEGGIHQSQIIADRAVAAFIDPSIQQYFDHPYILAPQCPDFWLESFTLNNKKYSGSQDYTKILIRLIKEIILSNKNIDLSRIYIIGSSMGGYQALKLLSDSPDLFAAGVIACPAGILKDHELKTLKNTPIWFLHSHKDTIVPIKNTEYMVSFLINKNAHIRKSIYTDIQLQEKTFDPHCVFLYLYENIPNLNGNSLFNWLHQQRKTS